MKTLKISLNSIDKVKAFVNEISKFDCDFDLVSGALDTILAVVEPYVIE